MYHDGKKKTIELLHDKYKDKKIVFIWDSVGDMEAGNSADLFIWYTGIIARTKVIAQCTTIANQPSDVISVIDTFIS
jgi:2-hydroxy-3-keto-5-methylthiopentenyl-1-phosphate phosphatase